MKIHEINVTEKIDRVREATELEVQELKELQLESNARALEAEAKATARASALAKLAALGLSPEEIAAL
jgi:hypothetical protein